jgi:hypothetical protein
LRQLSVCDADVLGDDMTLAYKTLTEFFSPWPRLKPAAAVVFSY